MKSLQQLQEEIIDEFTSSEHKAGEDIHSYKWETNFLKQAIAKAYEAGRDSILNRF